MLGRREPQAVVEHEDHQHHARGAKIDLKLQSTQVANAGAKNATLDDGTRDKVLSVVRAYLDNGVIKPLTSGSKVGDLSSVFDANTLTRATGADAATLFDAGVSKVSGLEAKTATVTLTDLAGEERRARDGRRRVGARSRGQGRREARSHPSPRRLRDGTGQRDMEDHGVRRRRAT